MVKQLLKVRKDRIALVYKYWRPIVVLLVVLVPAFLIVRYYDYAQAEDDPNEPYSIFILAGQSLAAGVESYRSDLEPGNTALDNCTSDPQLETTTVITQRCHPADFITKFWWAGNDGQGDGIEQTAALLGYDAANAAAAIRYGLGTPYVNKNGWAYSWNDNGTAKATGSPTIRDDRSKRLLSSLNVPQTLNSSGGQTGGLFGSEFGISRSLYNMGRRKVIILKVTYGLQPLGQPQTQAREIFPFDWNVNSSSSNPDKPKSYKQLTDQFDDLTQYLRDNGQKYTVDGIFWMQGESDTLEPTFSSAYQTNMQNLVNRARVDLQLHPYGHFVIGKTSMEYCINFAAQSAYNRCEYPNSKSFDPPQFSESWAQFLVGPNLPFQNDQVRAAQQAVADTDKNTTQKVDIFDTSDLTRGYDWVHLTAPGQIELGRRFVNMYKLPLRYDSGPLSTDYDNDGISNAAEDRNNNGNLGDDDQDLDGYPDYLDKTNDPDHPGSGL